MKKKLISFRQYLIRCGGWEQRDGSWRMRLASGERMGPRPISILGRRVTFLNGWFDIRLRRSWLVVHYHGSKYAYISPNGKASGATRWLFGYGTQAAFKARNGTK